MGSEAVFSAVGKVSEGQVVCCLPEKIFILASGACSLHLFLSGPGDWDFRPGESGGKNGKTKRRKDFLRERMKIPSHQFIPDVSLVWL